MTNRLSFTVGYTGVYNVLDYPSISFPTGITVDAAVDINRDDTLSPLSDLDQVIRNECTRSSIPYSYVVEGLLTFDDLDNAEVVHGMPISLQLVAQRLEEEKCIEMCKSILKTIE